MGGTATAALALEDCRERRLVTGAGAAALERKDPFSGKTPLIAQVSCASTRMSSDSSRPALTPTPPPQAGSGRC